MVSLKDITASLFELGIRQGDTIIVHSSLKSFGQVDGGADTVIDALIESVGSEGTVVVPTLAMKNFSEAYNTWHIDKPSDTGLITEVFRKRPNALRSDQATHSVAAIGKKAEYLTATHGQTGLRYGIYGNSPFAEDSPWQKLYDMNAKIVMLGVSFESCTLRHLCEYTLVDRALSRAKEKGKYDEFIKSVCCFETRHLRDENYFWPYINHEMFVEEIDKNGLSREVICGEATLKLASSKEVCDFFIESPWESPEKWFETNIASWYKRAKEL